MTLLRTPRRIVDRFLNDPASIRNAAFLIIGATAVAGFAVSERLRGSRGP